MSDWTPRKTLACTVPVFTAAVILLPSCIGLGGYFEQQGHGKAAAEYIACVNHAQDVRDCGARP